MTFREDMSAAHADIFAGLGEAAIWLPQGGASVAVMVRLRDADQSYSPAGIPIIAETPVMRIRQIDAATLKAGDHMTILGQTFRVGTPRVPDKLRLLWEAELSRA